MGWRSCLLGQAHSSKVCLRHVAMRPHAHPPGREALRTACMHVCSSDVAEMEHNQRWTLDSNSSSATAPCLQMFRSFGITQKAYEQFLKPTLLVS